MATSRYAFTKRIDGTKISTTDISSRIYFAAQNNQIGYNTINLADKQRLDHIAAKAYGDATLWWVIASASGIGWATQCPAGTVLRVPNDLNQIFLLMRQT
jgi:hypothetical protein